MERKSLAIIIIVVIVAAAGISIPLIILMLPPAEVKKDHLIFGVMYEMKDLDPHYSWDSASIDVLDQIVERLFTFDFSDSSLPQIPGLAVDDGTWSADNLEWTLDIRSGVTFHDGTSLDAAAVKWNFDRIMYFTNITGTLGADPGMSVPSYLYEGRINKTEVVDSDTVKITLNMPMAFFKAMTTFCGMGIISPTAHAAEVDDYIDLSTGDIVGTGPFVYDSFEAGVEVNMHAYEDYWGADGPSQIKNLTFTVITDSDARNAALFSGDIDIIDEANPPLIDTMNATTFLHVEGPVGSVITQYLGMNCIQINKTLRHALSSALDYDYIIDVFRDGRAVRLKSSIPIGISYANDGFNASVYDLMWARILMRSMYPAQTGALNMSILSTNDDWRALTASAPLLTYNYTYNIGNPTREGIFPLARDNFAEIGIKVTDAGGTWPQFLDKLDELDGHTRNELQLYWLGWGPDYPDGENYVNPLFTNASIASNGVQYNNPGADTNWMVQTWMDEAAEETDSAARKVLYDKIQKEMVENDKPWAFGYVPAVIDVYVNTLYGFSTNSQQNVWFYPCYFGDPR